MQKKLAFSQKKSPFERLLLAIALLLVFILLTRTPADADMWWHLRNGEEILRQGKILLTDQFSYTRYGEVWVNAFWLADVLFALIFKAGGFFALAGFVSLMGVLTFATVNRQLRAPAFLRALLLILAALTAAPIWTPRPQLFSFFLLAFLDLWLYRLKNGYEKRDWQLPLLFVLWANLHGGYIWGILLLIAFLVGESLQHWLQKEKIPAYLKALALYSLLSLFAVLLNPNGIALWRLPFHTLDVSLAIQEWLSPDFHQISLHPFLWMLFLLIFSLARTRQKIPFSDMLKLLGFAYLTFVSQRNLAPFAIIALPIVTRSLTFFWEEELAPRLLSLAEAPSTSAQPKAFPPHLTRLLNVFLLTLIGAAALGNLYLLTRPAKVEETYPAAAVQWIRENRPEGALFNAYNWGGYLIWALREYPVFIDGRADLYGEEMLNQWKQAQSGGASAQAILDQWDVNLILVEANSGLAGYLSQSDAWNLLHADETSVVYGR